VENILRPLVAGEAAALARGAIASLPRLPKRQVAQYFQFPLFLGRAVDCEGEQPFDERGFLSLIAVADSTDVVLVEHVHNFMERVSDTFHCARVVNFRMPERTH
jgi:hypothetical protein